MSINNIFHVLCLYRNFIVYPKGTKSFVGPSLYYLGNIKSQNKKFLVLPVSKLKSPGLVFCLNLENKNDLKNFEF